MTVHRHWEITAVVSGRGELACQSSLQLLPGTIVFVPPGHEHQEHATENIDTIWIGCRGSRFDALPHHTVTARDPQLVSECEQLWMLSQQATAKIGPELDAGLTSVVSRALRAHTLTGGHTRGDLLDNVIRYMHEHLARPLSVTELAHRAACSEGYFSRSFRKRTGESVVQFLTGLRIQKAAYLLEHTALPAYEIAEHVGFSSASYFNRVFHARIGLAPHAYRQRKMASVSG